MGTYRGSNFYHNWDFSSIAETEQNATYILVSLLGATETHARVPVQISSGILDDYYWHEHAKK